MEETYQEYRCPHCHKLLFKGLLEFSEDAVEVKCRGCGQLNVFKGLLESRRYFCAIEDCPRRVPLPKTANTPATD